MMFAMAARAIDEKLAIINETRKRPKLVPLDALKGRPPLRKCPDDFDTVFVEAGRIDCETYFRAARITINRWLEERGKERLLRLRREFVEHQRKQLGPLRAGVRLKDARPAKKPKPPKPVKDRRKVSPCVAAHAAHWLRMARNGGWRVSPTGKGDWFFGLKRVSPGMLLDMAVQRGFDARAARLTCELTEGLEQAVPKDGFGQYCRGKGCLNKPERDGLCGGHLEWRARANGSRN